MSPLDIEIVTERLRECQDLIKAQHKLPKVERDQRAIEAAKKKAEVFQRWLGEERPVPAATPARMTKKEFRKLYKHELGILDPEQIIQIFDMETLDKVWPHIRGKNVQVDAPPAIKEEIRRRVKNIHQAKKVNGFR